MQDVKGIVRKFLVDDLAIAQVATLADGDSLLATDVLDSTAVMELATFLQVRFEIEIRDEDLVPENLDSIDALAAFVGRKRAAAVAAA